MAYRMNRSPAPSHSQTGLCRIMAARLFCLIRTKMHQHNTLTLCANHQAIQSRIELVKAHMTSTRLSRSQPLKVCNMNDNTADKEDTSKHSARAQQCMCSTSCSLVQHASHVLDSATQRHASCALHETWVTCVHASLLACIPSYPDRGLLGTALLHQRVNNK